MLEWLAKYIGAKVLMAVCVLGCVLAGIWFWRHPEDLQALWTVIRLTLAWLVFVAVLPWALFFVPPMVVKAESNLLSAVMLLGYLLADVLVAFWLAGWHVGSTLGWVVLLAGFLAAAVYNFIVCESIAVRSEDNL
jgi:hypothetical protein